MTDKKKAFATFDFPPGNINQGATSVKTPEKQAHWLKSRTGPLQPLPTPMQSLLLPGQRDWWDKGFEGQGQDQGDSLGALMCMCELKLKWKGNECEQITDCISC